MAKQRGTHQLFYQDFNEQFEGYTQHIPSSLLENLVVLSGFQ